MQLEWLEAAVELAPEEEKGGVERELEGAVLEHDQVTRLVLKGLELPRNMSSCMHRLSPRHFSDCYILTQAFISQRLLLLLTQPVQLQPLQMFALPGTG